MPVASSRNSQHFSKINSDCSPNENPNATFKRRSVQKKDIAILVVNIQGLLVFNKDGVRANLTELEFHLASLQPHIVLLQETWLDASVESVSLVGYMVVSRRDRSAGTNRGGVLTLARHDFNRLVHIENSGYDERSWHYLHIESETDLLGNWYRPGATIHDGYVNLISEIEKHSIKTGTLTG